MDGTYGWHSSANHGVIGLALLDSVKNHFAGYSQAKKTTSNFSGCILHFNPLKTL